MPSNPYEAEWDAAEARKAARQREKRQRHKRELDLLMRLARHVRNTDTMPAIQWGAAGAELLIEVQAMFPERYDAEVKAQPSQRTPRGGQEERA